MIFHMNEGGRKKKALWTNGMGKCKNVMALAFIGNKVALIKGSQYSKGARLHSRGGTKCSPAWLSKWPDQLIRIQQEDAS